MCGKCLKEGSTFPFYANGFRRKKKVVEDIKHSEGAEPLEAYGSNSVGKEEESADVAADTASKRRADWRQKVLSIAMKNTTQEFSSDFCLSCGSSTATPVSYAESTITTRVEFATAYSSFSEGESETLNNVTAHVAKTVEKDALTYSDFSAMQGNTSGRKNTTAIDHVPKKRSSEGQQCTHFLDWWFAFSVVFSYFPVSRKIRSS